MRLYLATFKFESSPYLGESTISEPKIRMISAPDIEVAEDRLRNELERSAPYGTSVWIVDLEITACIE